MQAQQPSPQEAMLQMFTAYWLPQALHTVAKLRIPDRLMDGPRTAAELARDTEMHEDSLRRVLRALSSVGVFSETEDGRFGLTPLSQTIRSDQPDSLWGYLMLVNSDWFWRTWEQLPHAVRSGQPGFEQAHGQSFFEFLSSRPGAGETFNKAMTSFSAISGSHIVAERYDFSKVKSKSSPCPLPARADRAGARRTVGGQSRLFGKVTVPGFSMAARAARSR